MERYILIGTYQGKSERLDSFETLGEATVALVQYMMAYGKQWSIDIKFERGA